MIEHLGVSLQALWLNIVLYLLYVLLIGTVLLCRFIETLMGILHKQIVF